MLYDIQETIVEAIMSNTPVIIVEGSDDLTFYSNLCAIIKKKINVQAVETIEGYSEGCEQVKKAIENIQEEIADNNRIKDYVLGIIDRDAKKYRDELPNMNCLFVLEYYSFESHLITRLSIKKLVSLFTRNSTNMIEECIIDIFESDIDMEYIKLYYLSLEALKSSCDSSYSGIVTYGNKAGSILDKNAFNKIWPKILLKKNDLDLFAEEHGITINELKYIAKGKWYLHLWCDYFINKVHELAAYCGNSLPKCIFCETGKTEKCLRKVKVKFKQREITSLLYTADFFDLNELNYITERIKELKAS